MARNLLEKSPMLTSYVRRSIGFFERNCLLNIKLATDHNFGGLGMNWLAGLFALNIIKFAIL